MRHGSARRRANTDAPPGTNPIEDHFTLGNFPTLTAPFTTAEIYSVTLEFEHFGAIGSNPFTSCTNTGFLRLNGFESTTAAEVCLSLTPTLRTTVFNQRPGGGLWTLGDLDDVTMGITSTDTGGDQPSIDFVRLVVSYVATGQLLWSSTTLNANQEYDIVFTWSVVGGTGEWLLAVDGSSQAAVGASGSILANAISLSLGRDYDGRIGEVQVGTTPTDRDLVLDFTGLTQFQAGTSTNGFVWAGQFQDTSEPRLTASYQIVTDNTFLTTTVFALQVVPPTAPAAAEITTVDSVGDPSVAILFVTSTQSSDNPILGALFEACTAGGIPCDAWWLILTTFLVGVGGSVALSRFDSIPTVAAMSLAGFLVVALFGGYSPWVVAMTGLWFLGMVPLLQFANKS